MHFEKTNKIWRNLQIFYLLSSVTISLEISLYCGLLRIYELYYTMHFSQLSSQKIHTYVQDEQARVDWRGTVTRLLSRNTSVCNQILFNKVLQWAFYMFLFMKQNLIFGLVWASLFMLFWFLPILRLHWRSCVLKPAYWAAINVVPRLAQDKPKTGPRPAQARPKSHGMTAVFKDYGRIYIE